MKVTVRTLTGKTLSFDVEPTDKLDTIRSQLAGEFNVESRRIRLIFAGKQIEDGTTYGDHRIADGGAIHMTIRTG